MSEFTLTAPKTVPAGTVTFVAHRGRREHEMLIIHGSKYDCRPGPNGRVNEAAIDSPIVGEIEKVKAQTDKSPDFELSKATDTLFCYADSVMGGRRGEPLRQGPGHVFTVTRRVVTVGDRSSQSASGGIARWRR